MDKGPRLGPVDPAQMEPAQRLAYDEAVAGRRGKAPAPMMLWLHSPEMARHAQRLGESIRYELALPPRLIALAALTVAVHWNAAYVISVQSSKSRAAGIADHAIDAIHQGRAPVLADPADRITYATVRMLLDRRELVDDAYARAAALLGERELVELVATVGYYTTVSMTASVFAIPA